MRKLTIGIAVTLLIPGIIIAATNRKMNKVPEISKPTVAEAEIETETEKEMMYMLKSSYEPTPVEMLEVSEEIIVKQTIYYEVPFSKEQQDVMRCIAQEHGIDFKLLLAIGYTESRWNTMATSKSGSMGVFQVQPKWWSKFIQGRDLYDLYVNTEVACKILQEMYGKYTYTRNVLNAYNTGDSTNNNGYADLVLTHLAQIKELVDTQTTVVTYSVAAKDTHKG